MSKDYINAVIAGGKASACDVIHFSWRYVYGYCKSFYKWWQPSCQAPKNLSF